MSKTIKTNVMRILDAAKINYVSHCYANTGAISAEEICEVLGEDEKRVFKTLVTRGKSGDFLVFIVPAAGELNLKKASAAAKEKAVEMIKSKELLPVTGYVHGGCSPIGMKKKFRTFIDISALDKETIFVSAGKIGYQIELSPEDLITLCDITPCSITDI